MTHISRSLALTLLAGILLSVAAVLLFDRSNAHTSLFTLGNFVGPTAFTLLHGQGLTVCSTGMGTPGNLICFHAARMPLASAVVALGTALFGDRYLAVALFKSLLLLLPMLGAMVLAGRCLPASGWRHTVGLLLLLLPFLLTPFLADVVNVQVEEGYAYSLLSLAVALVFFSPGRSRTVGTVLLFSLTVALLYLAKSSLAPAVAVLSACFLWPLRRSPATVVLTLALVATAPLSWALWQHHTSGRYTLGTSLDGINLHKGNNPDFLNRYPPPPGSNLDAFDSTLSRGHTFPDEWTFNDFHQKAATAFLRSHPSATVRGDLRKLEVIFLSLHKIGSRSSGGLMDIVEAAGILVFRLLLWSALAVSALSFVARPLRPARAAASAFLLLVAAVCLPYLLGFAYTRHVSVLIAPSVLFFCAVLQHTLVSTPEPRLRAPGKAVH